MEAAFGERSEIRYILSGTPGANAHPGPPRPPTWSHICCRPAGFPINRLSNVDPIAKLTDRMAGRPTKKCGECGWGARGPPCTWVVWGA